MVVRAEYWIEDHSRIALFFIDEKFRGLYPRQRYHRLIHLIPSDYYRANLANCMWFELTRDERPEELDSPDEKLSAAIVPDVLHALEGRGFYVALDGLLCPVRSTLQPQTCSGDFRIAKHSVADVPVRGVGLVRCAPVLMEEGAFCDCEILFNAKEDRRLKAQYWRRSHEGARVTGEISLL